MLVTEIRVKLSNDHNEKLLAFASIVFDKVFVLHDIKVINGRNGKFIAFPDKKITYPCPECEFPNSLLSHYCNSCGIELDKTREDFADEDGKVKLHTNTGHPITAEYRDYLTVEILDEYEKEVDRWQHQS